MTEAIDTYIKDFVLDNIIDYEWDDFSEDVREITNWAFNTEDVNPAFDTDEYEWDNYEKPTLDELMTIQHACYNYLECCDSLDLITEKKRDWKWWFNIYAISNEWIEDWDTLKEECFSRKYDDAIINFQSNIRRRLATIKVIKKLHLTGSM